MIAETLEFADNLSKELALRLGMNSQCFGGLTTNPTDMYENDGELVVEIDMPGFVKNDIRVRIVDNVLLVHAQRDQPEKMSKGHIYYRNRPVQVSRRIYLPLHTKDEEKVIGIAKYSDGILTLRIPLSNTSRIQIS